MNSKPKNRQFIGIGLVVLAGLILTACQSAADMPAAAPENAYFTAPTAKATLAAPTAKATLAATLEAQSTGTSISKSSGKDDYGYDSSSTPAVPVTGSGIEIKVSTKDGLGTFLVDEKGMTLYLFTKDTPGVSNCSGSCLTAWPPLLTSDEPRADDGVTGKLGTITRDDGSLQVTYNDMPLYYYVTDVKPGDTTGQDVGGVWFVVAP